VTSDRAAATPREPMLEVDHLRVWFPVRGGGVRQRRYVHAVDDVTLSLGEGETLGLVGESGCGKTTLARTLLRLTDPTDGSFRFRGREISGLGSRALEPYRREVQMVFQDPQASLNPRKRIEQILQAALRLRREDDGNPRTTVATLLQQVGLDPEFAQRYPHEFSGGQRQRIGIARALAVGPKVVILDEPVSALDVSVRAQVINLLDDLQGRFGLSYVFVAHDLAVVRHISDTIGVMYLGSLVEEADGDQLYERPLHPYTRALLSAVPIPDPYVEDQRKRILLAGDLPSPANPPSGCRFRTRCPWSQNRCADERPELRVFDDSGQRVACHFAEDILSGELTPHEVRAELVRPDADTTPDVGAELIPTRTDLPAP
jgi:peptide/nickel transport system ATP-binding protein